MTKSQSIALMIAGAIVLAATAAPALAAEPTTIDFSNETVGAEPKSLLPVVGFWRIENDSGKKVLAVEGTVGQHRYVAFDHGQGAAQLVRGKVQEL